MRLTLVSEQLVFLSGSVHIVRPTSLLESRAAEHEARVEDDVVEGLADVGSGPLFCVIHNCAVQFRRDATRRLLDYAVLGGEPIERAGGHAGATLPVGELVHLIVDVSDANGIPLDSTPAIGVAAEGVTIELPPTNRRRLELLVPPAEYAVYVGGQPASMRTIAVGKADNGTAAVTLRLSMS